jgi:hypothetical protein
MADRICGGIFRWGGNIPKRLQTVGRKISGELTEPILIGEYKRIPKLDDPKC